MVTRIYSSFESSADRSLRDLSDLNHDYCLSRDEFVIAMHLIEQRINGVQLPSVLPASLLPPSLREQPPHSALRPSATSPNHMKSMPRAHSNTISGNPPLPPKPTYSSHPSRYSVPASKGVYSLKLLRLFV